MKNVKTVFENKGIKCDYPGYSPVAIIDRGDMQLKIVARAFGLIYTALTSTPNLPDHISSVHVEFPTPRKRDTALPREVLFVELPIREAITEGAG